MANAEHISEALTICEVNLARPLNDKARADKLRVWGLVLSDLDGEALIGAAVEHVRMHQTYHTLPTPGDLRQLVLYNPALSLQHTENTGEALTSATERASTTAWRKYFETVPPKYDNSWVPAEVLEKVGRLDDMTPADIERAADDKSKRNGVEVPV